HAEGGTGQEPGSTDPLRDRVEGAIKSEHGLRAGLRALPTPTRISLLVGAGLVLGFGAGAVHMRPDIGAYPGTRFALELLSLAGLVVAATAMHLRPLHRPAPSRVSVALLVGAAALLLAGVVIMAPVTATHPASFLAPGESFFRRALSCFGFGSVVALVPMALLFFVARQRPDVRHGLTAAVFGAAIANFALEWHCPVVATGHLLAGHASILLALAAVLTFATAARGRHHAPTTRT
ncbi:MAG: DUF1109 family protein, partial [Myxococcales bacterium]|nr:DUF1109 family protein [Myxococcales bacterium]